MWKAGIKQQTIHTHACFLKQSSAPLHPCDAGKKDDRRTEQTGTNACGGDKNAGDDN